MVQEHPPLGDFIMFCARKDEKLLPASVVNDALAEKVTEIEQQQARKISRKEKAQFKDDVIAADLAVTRLKFEDMILERAQETDAESEAQQFDQDFAIMSLEISRLLKSLLAVFGGLSEVEAGVVAGPRKADQVSGHY